MPARPVPDHSGRRIIATILDRLVLFGFMFLYGASFGSDTPEGGKQLNGLLALPVPAFWLFYIVLPEAWAQQTVGHRVVGLKVISLDGQPFTFTQALKRRLMDFIDLGFFGLVAMIVINVSPLTQRVGYMWAGTRVVRSKKDVNV